jgi:hypothetical protein
MAFAMWWINIPVLYLVHFHLRDSCWRQLCMISFPFDPCIALRCDGSFFMSIIGKNTAK